jgi:hypothetical protein
MTQVFEFKVRPVGSEGVTVQLEIEAPVPAFRVGLMEAAVPTVKK